MNRVGDLIARLSLGNGPRRAVLGTALTGHTKVMEPERDRHIRLEGQVRRHRLEAHVVAVFRREDPPCPAEFPDPGIQGNGDHVQFGIAASPGLAIHGVVAQPSDEIGQLRGDQFEPAVGFRGRPQEK